MFRPWSFVVVGWSDIVSHVLHPGPQHCLPKAVCHTWLVLVFGGLP
jgi:hypothetical protein